MLSPGKSVCEVRHVVVSKRSDCLDPLTRLHMLARMLSVDRRFPACLVFVSFTKVRGSQRFWPVTRGAFTARLKAAVRTVLGLDPAFY